MSAVGTADSDTSEPRGRLASDLLLGRAQNTSGRDEDRVEKHFELWSGRKCGNTMLTGSDAWQLFAGQGPSIR